MPFTPGFDKQEALDLLVMSAIIEDVTLPPPSGWKMLYTSEPFLPFNNKWALWQRGSDSAFALVNRGTVPEIGSVVEDILALMIEATGEMTLCGYKVPYQFAPADDKLAAVHIGFAAATILITDFPGMGIIDQMKYYGVGSGSSVYITGHSQGAAMATLLTSYLHFHPSAPKGVSYKTYAFAQPKPGNDHYASDFEHRFSNHGYGFRVTNSFDWVPQVPFTWEWIGDLNTPNLLSVQSPSAQLATIGRSPLTQESTKLVQDAGHALVERELARVRPAIEKLVAAKGAPAAALSDCPFDAPIVLTFNYVAAGTNFSLIGTPCTGKDCNNPWFEHSATTYLPLLQKQG